MRGFWQNDHRLRPSELCSTTCSHSLTTISVPTIFRKLWVDSGAVIGSELCYRSTPSSTFVKQFSFPIFNTALLYLETVSRGRHWNDSNIAEYHHPFSVRAQMVRSNVLPRGSQLVLCGILTYCTAQKVLATEKPRYLRKKLQFQEEVAHAIHVLLIRGIAATEPLVCCYKPYFLHNSGVYY